MNLPVLFLLAAVFLCHGEENKPCTPLRQQPISRQDPAPLFRQLSEANDELVRQEAAQARRFCGMSEDLLDIFRKKWVPNPTSKLRVFVFGSGHASIRGIAYSFSLPPLRRKKPQLYTAPTP